MKHFTCEVDGNIVRSPGIDWGRPLEILHQNRNLLVLRRKGHMTWASLGQQRYAETLYMFVQLGEERVSARHSVNGKAFTLKFADVLERVEPGTKWRAAVKRLIARCDGGG